MFYNLSKLNFNNKMVGCVYIIDDGGNEYEVPINKNSEKLLSEGGVFAKAYLDDEIGQFIIVDDNFEYAFKANEKRGQFIIWHEIGHLVTTKWDDPILEKDQYEVRKKHVEEGKVFKYELLADEFAVSKTDKKCAFEGLDLLIDFFNNNYKDAYRSICIEEFKLRKQHIEKM